MQLPPAVSARSEVTATYRSPTSNSTPNLHITTTLNLHHREELDAIPLHTGFVQRDRVQFPEAEQQRRPKVPPATVSR